VAGGKVANNFPFAPKTRKKSLKVQKLTFLVPGKAQYTAI
jgi:hypothetical protein